MIRIILPASIVSRNINSLDFILNQKDFLFKNLDLQLLTKNVIDERQFKGSALDPAHREQQWPFYYEARLVYLWGTKN